MGLVKDVKKQNWNMENKTVIHYEKWRIFKTRFSHLSKFPLKADCKMLTGIQKKTQLSSKGPQQALAIAYISGSQRFSAPPYGLQ